jgi:hypothetical protein
VAASEQTQRPTRVAHGRPPPPVPWWQRASGFGQERASVLNLKSLMDRWQQYLFESHPEPQLRDWAQRLRLFRFCRAYGGHANDGDSLDVVFPYEAIEELQQFFLALGIGLVEYDQQPAQPEVGRAYRGDVFQQYVSLIPHTRWIKQPGHCKIAGHDVFAWCDGKEIRISIGANYSVTEENVSAAQAVEEALVAAPLRPKDPPRDTQHCICPKYYPAYFEG